LFYASLTLVIELLNRGLVTRHGDVNLLRAI